VFKWHGIHGLISRSTFQQKKWNGERISPFRKQSTSVPRLILSHEFCLEVIVSKGDDDTFNGPGKREVACVGGATGGAAMEAATKAIARQTELQRNGLGKFHGPNRLAIDRERHCPARAKLLHDRQLGVLGLLFEIRFQDDLAGGHVNIGKYL